MEARSGTARRAVAGSTAGAIVEGYDLLLYAIFGVLVFPTVFFSAQAGDLAVLAAFGTYFAGFVARPVGGIVFGHLGDRIGRKKTMLLTLVLVTIGTVGCGFLPGYDTLGVAAPVLLVLLRAVQGFGFGGEWGGAVLLAMESGGRRRTAFRGSFPQAAAHLGFLLANLSALALLTLLPRADFLAWGWRIPFLASGVLIAVGFWVRTRVAETPAFEELRAAGAVEKNPLRAVLRHQRGTLGLTILLKAGSGVPLFVFTSFVTAYATAGGAHPPLLVTVAVSAGALVAVITTPLYGLLADRVGPARVWQAGAVLTAVFGFAYFPLLDAGPPVAMFLAVVVSTAVVVAMFAVEPALTGPRFAPAWRFTGSSLAFNIGSVLGGGAAPFVAQVLVIRTGGPLAVSVYIAAACALGLVAATRLRLRPETHTVSVPVSA
ncbi:MFS transporter [Amycolatopsis endophytica]|uniref:MFS family permease n=1 Tax=Amycolatopsis endophytica TaxID=860233 RepID=A0A853BCB4_9PSEU|nr:MFS transporter [Amycolatopsis endophytica]NYI92392.1 MFS family permease [Amycolatopsis endophytica]